MAIRFFTQNSFCPKITFSMQQFYIPAIFIAMRDIVFVKNCCIFEAQIRVKKKSIKKLKVFCILKTLILYLQPEL